MIGIYVVIGGLLTILGPLFGYEILATGIYGHVTTKPLTGLMFMIAGMGLFFEHIKKGSFASFFGLLLLAFVSLISYGVTLDITPEWENWLLVNSELHSIDSVRPGEPSLITVSLFALIGFTLTTGGWKNRFRDVVTWLTCIVVSITCLLGHITGSIELQWGGENSTAMAIPTALLFLLWGYGQTKLKFKEIIDDIQEK